MGFRTAEESSDDFEELGIASPVGEVEGVGVIADVGVEATAVGTPGPTRNQTRARHSVVE